MAKKKANKKNVNQIEKQPNKITLGGVRYEKKTIINPETNKKQECLVELRYYEIINLVCRKGLYGAFKNIYQAVKFKLGGMGKSVVGKSYGAVPVAAEDNYEIILQDFFQWQKTLKTRRISASPVIDIIAFSMTFEQVEGKYNLVKGTASKLLIRSLRLWGIYE